MLYWFCVLGDKFIKDQLLEGGEKMITLEQAKGLHHGQILHHVTNKNADKTPQRWKVNGKVKTWKRSPERVRIPVKYGLYSFDYITEDTLDLVSFPD